MNTCVCVCAVCVCVSVCVCVLIACVCVHVCTFYLCVFVQVKIQRASAPLYGTIQCFMLYGDYEGDVFSTGGEVEIAQVSTFVVE